MVHGVRSSAKLEENKPRIMAEAAEKAMSQG
jgi:hypothetical protein